jgi:hypothetical protein
VTATASVDAKYNQNHGYCAGDAGGSGAWECSDSSVPCGEAPEPAHLKEKGESGDDFGTIIVVVVICALAIPVGVFLYRRKKIGAVKVAAEHPVLAPASALAEKPTEADGPAVIKVAPADTGSNAVTKKEMQEADVAASVSPAAEEGAA